MVVKVLLVGIHPRKVDLSDPFFPDDLTDEKISESIDESLAEMKGRGWEPAFCGLHLVSARADKPSSPKNGTVLCLAQEYESRQRISSCSRRSWTLLPAMLLKPRSLLTPACGQRADLIGWIDPIDMTPISFPLEI
jgi:hypothetical protein